MGTCNQFLRAEIPLNLGGNGVEGACAQNELLLAAEEVPILPTPPGLILTAITFTHIS